MNHVVTGCLTCPLYFYKVNDSFQITSICKHPKSTIVKIDRVFNEGHIGAVPITPENECPLNLDSITISKQ